MNVDIKFSLWEDSDYGVPQGVILHPLFFNHCVNVCQNTEFFWSVFSRITE